MTLLHEAASNGDLLQLEEALKDGEHPDEPDIDWGNRTPLHIACSVGSKKCTYILITKGCDLNAQTDTGFTPAHFACEGGHSQCLQLLLAHGGEATQVDNYGDTPLRIAERYGHQECVDVIKAHLIGK